MVSKYRTSEFKKTINYDSIIACFFIEKKGPSSDDPFIDVS